MDASRLQALPISRLQFNVQTKCRDAGESLTNANAARIVVTNSVEVSRQTSAEAAMRRTGPLKQAAANCDQAFNNEAGRGQPRDSLRTQSSENISIWNRVEGDARGFRQDLRGSIDCRSDALFARCYRRPYRTLT